MLSYVAVMPEQSESESSPSQREDYRKDSQELRDARNSLLRYYSSKCMSHGTYILTIVIGIFAFFQSLPDVASYFEGQHFESLFLWIGISSFVLLMIRQLVRTIRWAHLATAVLCARPMSYEDAKKYASWLTNGCAKGTSNFTLLISLQLKCDKIFREKNKILRLLTRFGELKIFLSIWVITAGIISISVLAHSSIIS